jgi:drug/metabolite transporter (DMT)-like permease
VRLAGDVPDPEHLYTHALEGPRGHVAPEPWPLTSMSTRRTPWSIALFAQLSAVIWAAYGVLLRLPLKPKAPADSQAMTLPSWSVTLTMVLLNELFICTTPVVTFLRTLRRDLLAPPLRCPPRCC